MLGDRQGWMIEKLRPRLGPRNQIWSSPGSRIWAVSCEYFANQDIRQDDYGDRHNS